MAKRVKNNRKTKRRTYRKKTNRVSRKKRMNNKTKKRNNKPKIKSMIKIGGSDENYSSGKLQIDSEKFFTLLKMLGISSNLADKILNSANRAETASVEELKENYGSDIGISLLKGLAIGGVGAAMAGSTGAAAALMVPVAKKLGLGAGAQIAGDKIVGYALKLLDKKFFDDLTSLLSNLVVFSFDNENDILEINLIESGSVISLKLINDKNHEGVKRLPLFFINIKDILILILPEILKILKQNENINDAIIKAYKSFELFEKDVYGRMEDEDGAGDEGQEGGDGFFDSARKKASETRKKASESINRNYQKLKDRIKSSKQYKAINEYKKKGVNKLKDKISVKFALLGLDLFIFIQNKLDDVYKYQTLVVEGNKLYYCNSDKENKLYNSGNKLEIAKLMDSKQASIDRASKEAEKIMNRIHKEEQEEPETPVQDKPSLPLTRTQSAPLLTRTQSDPSLTSPSISPLSEPLSEILQTPLLSSSTSKTLQAPAPISLETVSEITDQSQNTSSDKEIKKLKIKGLKESCIRDNCDGIRGPFKESRKNKCIDKCDKKAEKIINTL